MSLIEISSVAKIYHTGSINVHALDHVSLKIEQGESVALMGESGSGKSTLMNIIGLLDIPSSGKYILDGDDSKHLTDNERSKIRNHKIGFVFQSFFLLPRLNILHNVVLPLLYRGIHPIEAKEQALKLLKRLKIEQHAKKKPHEMSGGQQQRAAIARALIGNPSIILADEPTGALDSKTSTAIMQLFMELQQERHCTLVIVTHNIKVGESCERLIEMVDGKLRKDKSP